MREDVCKFMEGTDTFHSIYIGIQQYTTVTLPLISTSTSTPSNNRCHQHQIEELDLAASTSSGFGIRTWFLRQWCQRQDADPISRQCLEQNRQGCGRKSSYSCQQRVR
eukprot:m.92645 g.92645  ORF g.92645 m.92645 type:complete len:108 (-) comp26561_c1_seq1:126-449(-)